MIFFEDLIGFIEKFHSISFKFTDVLDILLVTFVVYECIKFIRETRAFQLIKGIFFLGVAYFLVQGFNMQASTYILRFVFTNIIIILVVVFSDEIRSVIEHIGIGRFSFISSIFRDSKVGLSEEENEAIIEVCKAVERMSESKTGALIVFEKYTPLGDIKRTGTGVDAKITHELIGNVFYPKSPLHDGAAVVCNGRLAYAGCILPNTYNTNISSELGTRHRAAIGMSEQSDAAVVVVSEETGTISIAVNGKLERDFTESQLRDRLIDYLSDENAQKKNRLTKILERFNKGGKK